MSIFHCSVKIIGRSGGRSACSAAAYRSGEKIIDEETGITHDYTRKGGIAYSEILLCKHAPSEYADRGELWNAVEAVEKQGNAQLAREIEVALPSELSREEQIATVHDYVARNFVEKGMCADWSLHDKRDGNPHAHIMLTTRPIKENGEWDAKKRTKYKLDEAGNRIPILDKRGKQKIGSRGRKLWERVDEPTTDWNSKERMEEWRKAWADECNKRLAPAQRIDHRSYERQGVEKIPTVHEGYSARKIEQEGGISDLCERNREINRLNEMILLVKQELENLYEQAKRQVRSKEDALHERIGNLLQRSRNARAVGRTGTEHQGEGGAAGHHREPEQGTRIEGVQDTDALIRRAEAAIRTAENERLDREAEQRRKDTARERKPTPRERIAKKIHERDAEKGKGMGYSR